MKHTELDYKYCVYIHILDDEPIYVGSSNNKERPFTYYSRNNNYYDIVKGRFKDVVVKIVKTFDTKQEALDYEEKLTLFYKRLGLCKGNIKYGNKGYIHSKESKLKMSQPGKLNGMYGRTHTDEAKVKISIANVGKTWSQHHKDKYKKWCEENPNPFYGKTHTKESRLKMSKNHHKRKGCKLILPNGEEHIFTSRMKCSEFLNMDVGNVINIINSKLPYKTKYKKFKHLEGMIIQDFEN